jgi:hypothetical protein
MLLVKMLENVRNQTFVYWMNMIYNENQQVEFIWKCERTNKRKSFSRKWTLLIEINFLQFFNVQKEAKGPLGQICLRWENLIYSKNTIKLSGSHIKLEDSGKNSL